MQFTVLPLEQPTNPCSSIKIFNSKLSFVRIDGASYTAHLDVFTLFWLVQLLCWTRSKRYRPSFEDVYNSRQCCLVFVISCAELAGVRISVLEAGNIWYVDA